MAVFDNSGGSTSISPVFYVYPFNSKNFQQQKIIIIIKIASNMAWNVKISAENEVFDGSSGFVPFFSVLGVDTLNSEI